MPVILIKFLFFNTGTAKEDNYMRKEIRQNDVVAITACLLTIPFITMAAVMGYEIHGKSFFHVEPNMSTLIVLVANAFVCIPHELIHALGFILGGGKVSFGIHFPISVFTRFQGTMTLRAFRIALLAPFIITSLLPMLIGSVSGCFLLFLSGAVQATACGSDILLYLQGIRFNGQYMVSDTTGATGYDVIC